MADWLNAHVAGKILGVPGVYNFIWWLGGTCLSFVIPKWLNPRVAYFW